jgi:hypothetical protein
MKMTEIRKVSNVPLEDEVVDIIPSEKSLLLGGGDKLEVYARLEDIKVSICSRIFTFTRLMKMK